MDDLNTYHFRVHHPYVCFIVVACAIDLEFYTLAIDDDRSLKGLVRTDNTGNVNLIVLIEAHHCRNATLADFQRDRVLDRIIKSA